MAQSVGDLVVDIGADFTKLKEQLIFARKQLRDLGGDADSATKDVSAAFAKQELAAKRAGISVGQYRAAMRTLPAQFTDIATQLAGGQSPWLILLQQGGQIKDTFGGLRPTFTSLVGALNPVTVGVAGLAAAVGAVAYSFYTGQSILSDYNKSLVMTGDRAGQTANNLLFMNESMEKAGGSFSSGTAAISALVKAGANLGQNYQGVASSIATLSKVTSTSVDDLAAVFGKITNDPESGLRAMAEQYGHVSAAQLDYVSALQDAGKYTDALNYANGVAAAGFKDMSANVQENMGYLETAAKSVGNAFSWMWNQLLDLGRQESLQQQLADATDRLYELDKALKQSGAQGQQRMGMERARDLARQQVSAITDQLHAEQRKTEEQQRQANLQASTLKNQQHFQSIADAGLTKEQQRTQEYQRLNTYIAERKKLNQALSDEEIAQIKKGIEERYKDPKTPKAQSYSDDAGQRLLNQINQQTAALQQQLGTTDKLTGAAQARIRFEQQIADLQKRQAAGQPLSKDQQSLLANADQIKQAYDRQELLSNQVKTLDDYRKMQDAVRDKGEKYNDDLKERLELLEKAKATGTVSDSDYRDTRKNILENTQLKLPDSVKSNNDKSTSFGGLLYGTYAGLAMQSDQLGKTQKDLDTWQEQSLEALETSYEQKLLTTQEYEQKIQDVRKTYAQTQQNLDTQNQTIQTTAIQATMDSIVDITRTGFGEKSAIYKAAFIADKAYAIAQSTVAISAGIAQAANAPFPSNLIAMAAVAANTASIISNIQSVMLTGMAHSGIDSVPETGTWLLQRGERVVTSNTSAKLDATLAQIQQQKDQDRAAMAAGFSYSPTIQVNGDPDARTLNMLESAVKRGAQQGYDMVTNHLASGQGRVSKAVGGKWATKRRTG